MAYFEKSTNFLGFLDSNDTSFNKGYAKLYLKKKQIRQLLADVIHRDLMDCNVWCSPKNNLQ